MDIFIYIDFQALPDSQACTFSPKIYLQVLSNTSALKFFSPTKAINFQALPDTPACKSFHLDFQALPDTPAWTFLYISTSKLCLIHKHVHFSPKIYLQVLSNTSALKFFSPTKAINFQALPDTPACKSFHFYFRLIRQLGSISNS